NTSGEYAQGSLFVLCCMRYNGGGRTSRFGEFWRKGEAKLRAPLRNPKLTSQPPMHARPSMNNGCAKLVRQYSVARKRNVRRHCKPATTRQTKPEGTLRARCKRQRRISKAIAPLLNKVWGLKRRISRGRSCAVY